jgi:hypothetical protein
VIARFPAITAAAIMAKSPLNFIRIDCGLPENAVLVRAMLAAREVVARRARSSSQEPITDAWWVDVLADWRARTGLRPVGSRGIGGKLAQRTYYTLADISRPRLSVACTKCARRAEFTRTEMTVMYGTDYPLTDLLERLAAPDCTGKTDQWNRCGAYYINLVG